VNYDNSLVVTITVAFYLWAPFIDDHLFTCGAISRPLRGERGCWFCSDCWSSL